MQWLKRIAIGLVSLIVLLALIGLLLPAKTQVERSIVIERPLSLVHPLLNSFKRFNEWSPWFAADPNAEYTYSGGDSGVGAKMAWKGNESVGQGSQTITASEPERIAVDLDFGEMGIAKAEYRLAAEGKGTRVTWAFETDAGYDLLNRWFGLLMDRFIGADYERGLAQLQKLALTLPDVDIAGADIAIVERAAQPILYVTASSTTDPAAIAQAYGNAYGLIGAQMGKAGLEQSGAPMGIDNYYDERGYSFDAAIPVARTDVELEAPVQAGTSYAGRAVRVRHTGPYTGLNAAEAQGKAFIAVHGLKSKDRTLTEFVSDPGNTPEAELISDIYLPIE